MALVEFGELESLILPDIPEATEFHVARAARRVAQDFFARTEAWRYRLTYFPIVEGVNTYRIRIPSSEGGGLRVHRALHFTLDGLDLEASSPELLSGLAPRWRTQPAPVRYYYLDPEGQLVVAPLPGKTYADPGLDGELALKPTRASTALPERLVDEHERALVHGILAELFLEAGMPWFNTQRAAIAAARYEEAITRAGIHARRDDTPKRRTVRYGGY